MPATLAGPRHLPHDARIIGVVGVAHGTSHFYHLIVAPLFPWLKEAFGLSYAELGLLMTAFFTVSGIGQAAAGFVVDRIGALRVLLAGLGLLALAAFGLSLSRNYGMLLASCALAGLGNSVFHPADYTILNKRVSATRLGHAFSMHGILGTLGWATAPVFLVGLTGVIGWRGALVAAAVLAAGVFLMVWAHRDQLETHEAHPSAQPGKARSEASTLSFLRLPGVWAVFGFFFISSMALGGIQSFVPAALRELYAIPVTLATASITAYMLAQAGGMALGGLLAARTHQHDRVVGVAFALATAVSLLIATAWPPSATVIALVAVIGLAAGIAAPSRDFLVRAAAPRNATGRVYGVVYSGLDIGVSFAPLIFGALMDSRHPAWVFVAIGVFQVLALFTAVGIGGSAVKRRAHAATSA
jgi:MFS family permease